MVASFTNRPISEAKKNIIINEIETYLEKGLHINFERKSQLQRSKSGKLKQFSSLMKSNK